jgi:hypothetical protein
VILYDAFGASFALYHLILLTFHLLKYRMAIPFQAYRFLGADMAENLKRVVWRKPLQLSYVPLISVQLSETGEQPILIQFGSGTYFTWTS